MNTTESDDKMNWTINIEAGAGQTEVVQKLIDQFISQLQAVGARYSTMQTVPLHTSGRTFGKRERTDAPRSPGSNLTALLKRVGAAAQLAVLKNPC